MIHRANHIRRIVCVVHVNNLVFPGQIITAGNEICEFSLNAFMIIDEVYFFIVERAHEAGNSCLDFFGILIPYCCIDQKYIGHLLEFVLFNQISLALDFLIPVFRVQEMAFCGKIVRHVVAVCVRNVSQYGNRSPVLINIGN